MRFLAVIFFVISFEFSFAEVFKIATPALIKVNPITNQINFGNYLGMHLYFPLFEREQTGKLASHFLELSTSKSLDTSFKKFRLCLKQGVRFVDKSLISTSDFLGSLQLMVKMYPHLVPAQKISVENDRCLLLEMSSSTPHLFDRLTGIASTILKLDQTEKELPVGLGLYKVIEVNPQRVLLSFVGKEKIKFDTIEFVLVKNGNQVDQMNFHDSNQIVNRKSIPNSKEMFSKFEVSIPKTFVLVVNLKNRAMRLCAKSLLEKVDWIKAYRLSATYSKNFLPWKKKLLFEESRKSPKCKSNTVKLFVPNLYDSKAIRNEIIEAGLEKQIDTFEISNDEFGKLIFSGKSYVGLVGFDSTSSISVLEGDYSTYFESFFSLKNRIVTKPNFKIKEMISDAFRISGNAFEREKKFAAAESELILEGFVVPVGLLKKEYIFPKEISIHQWFDQINGIPNISKIR